MSNDVRHDSGHDDLLAGPWLTPREVADRLQVDNETLRRWAREGEGPPFVQIAKATRRYPQAGLTAWIRERAQLGSERRAS